MTTPDRRPGWHWSDYWRSGRADVMTVQTPTGPVSFDTRRTWDGFFASFDDGSRLIDLATGSGQVAAFAVEAARAGGKRFEITGVDYADLGPARVEGCVLRGGVALEALPFPPTSFDGASSRFGIEYADTRRALSELARVLTPGGRALLLLHHADSVVTQQTREQIAAYDTVLSDGTAVRMARKLFAAHAKRAAGAAAQVAAAAAMQAALQRAGSRLKPGPAFEPTRYMVGYLADLANRATAYEPRSALERLDAFEQGNAAWRRRQGHQVEVALDEAGAALFVQRAERAGLDLTEQGLETDTLGALIGRRIALIKR